MDDDKAKVFKEETVKASEDYESELETKKAGGWREENFGWEQSMTKDKKTRREQWKCSRCGNIFCGDINGDRVLFQNLLDDGFVVARVSEMLAVCGQCTQKGEKDPADWFVDPNTQSDAMYQIATGTRPNVLERDYTEGVESEAYKKLRNKQEKIDFLRNKMLGLSSSRKEHPSP